MARSQATLTGLGPRRFAAGLVATFTLALSVPGAPLAAGGDEASVATREAIHAWVQAEGGGSVPAHWGDEELGLLFTMLGAEAHPGSPRGERILGGMVALRSGTLKTWVDDQLIQDTTPAGRTAALRVYGRVGRSTDISRCVELTGSGAEAPSTGPEYRHALAQILRRHPDTYRHLWALLEDAPGHLLAFTYSAVADAPAATAVLDLASFLPQDGGHRVELLEALARIGEALDPPFGDEACREVRRWLASDETPVLAAAAAACAGLEDSEATARLIELIEDADAGVRHAAHEALKRISGQRFRSQPARWRSWFAGEEEWWSEHSEVVFRNLREGSPPEATHAIGEILAHSLHRHRLAAALVSVLDREEEGVRRLAVLGLGQLGSPVGIPALRDACDDDSETVRAVAEQALVACLRSDQAPNTPGR